VSGPLLSIRDVSKSFPGLKALDRVSMEVRAGEIVAVVGQNGSGKSTLVKILAGVYQPDPGSKVTLGGDGGEAASLHFIHQDLGLVESLTTIENISLGRQERRSALLRLPKRQEEQRAGEMIAEFGGSFDVTRPISELTAAERTIVALARALDGWTHSRNVLVLDEPTAALHGDEVEKLFVAVRNVAARGTGVIFISHRLDEVIELADEVVVLRDGRVIGTADRGRYRHEDLVQLIAGSIAERDDQNRRPEVGTSAALSVRGLRGATVRDLSFEVRPGEVLGVSGVLGSGRDEICSLIFGAKPLVGGAVTVGATALRSPSARRAIRAGLGYVPANRVHDGAVMNMTVRENITLPRLGPLRGFGGRLAGGQEREEVAEWVEKVDLRPADPERRIALFSGGNQQKAVLAKWLRLRPKVLLLDEPTQGVDVGAKAGVFDLIDSAAADGMAVLVCSSDEKELATICHRVLVVREGRPVAELAREDLSEVALVGAGLGLVEDKV
jgi:ABC-type sugar transport system ATPase subunit